MPIVNVWSNVPSSSVDTSKTLKDLTTVASQAIGKSESLFNIILNLDTNVAFGGAEDPAAYVEVTCIGVLGPEKNAEISKKLSDAINSHLKVPTDRFYIRFCATAPYEIGYKGSTF